MGFFRRGKRIEGTAVVSTFGIDETTSSVNESSHQHRTKGSLTLEVRGPDGTTRTAVVRGKFPAQQFPEPGQELPVRWREDDPDDVEIDWDRVPTIVERMTLLAEQAREAQRTGEQVGRVQPPSPGPTAAPE